MLTKALPLLIMTTGVVANADKIKSILGHTTTVAVQAEVNEISHLIVLDQISGEKLPGTPQEVVEYLRKNMRVKGQIASETTRDPSKDQFGVEYHVTYGEGSVIVTSAGPDKTFDTSDDVYSKRNL
jgi:hypothetical protein